MRLLATLHRHPNLNIHGLTTYREAVRAIIQRDRSLLMVFSPVNGDYKFPGGGVEADEPHAAALAREVREECGANLTHLGEPFGKVIELIRPTFPGYDVLKMTSYYYLCQTDDSALPLRLDDYEAELQFQPVWVEVEAALRENRSLLEAGRDPQGWTRRETVVLGAIWEGMIASS